MNCSGLKIFLHSIIWKWGVSISKFTIHILYLLDSSGITTSRKSNSSNLWPYYSIYTYKYIIYIYKYIHTYIFETIYKYVCIVYYMYGIYMLYTIYIIYMHIMWTLKYAYILKIYTYIFLNFHNKKESIDTYTYLYIYIYTCRGVN